MENGGGNVEMSNPMYNEDMEDDNYQSEIMSKSFSLELDKKVSFLCGYLIDKMIHNKLIKTHQIIIPFFP